MVRRKRGDSSPAGLVGASGGELVRGGGVDEINDDISFGRAPAARFEPPFSRSAMMGKIADNGVCVLSC